MCGIAGIFSNNDLDLSSVEPMIFKLKHRGPNDSGKLLSKNKKLVLGHSRLSIIDLSKNGHQPMLSNTSRYMISYNGEIYNFKNLKKELQRFNPNIKFSGSSDTEVLVNYIEAFGIKKTLNDIKGMFAFALWDNKEEELTLARDIAGEKPLYYGYINGNLFFASELKAIKEKEKNLKINHDAVRLMLKYNCIPSPYSIYKNIYKVDPASFYRFKSPSSKPKTERYFSPEIKLRNNLDEKYLDRFEELLDNSVRSQMVSDVPIGSFLSGGVDSSIISYYMQQNSDKPINTFSIGFNDESYNEAPFAKDIANAIGTNHHELYIDDNDMKDFIYKLPEIYCEPFSDSSQIPTYFVSKFASKSVKVCLTGDAGDELFGGYNRYLFSKRYWNKMNTTPKFLKKIISDVLLNTSSNKIEGISQNFFKILSKKMPSDFGGKIHKFANSIKAESPHQYHDINTTHWHQNSNIYNYRDFIMPKLYRDNAGEIKNTEDMLISDFYGYLHDDNLCKVDRASMSVSLETRVPFLDKDIINFAYSIPFDLKIKGGDTKWLLKKLLFKRMPKNLFERPKSGFAIPIHNWMRHDMRDWIEHLLDLQMEDNEIINYEEIKKIWQKFKKGDNSYTYPLWDIIMLRAWLDNQ